MSTNDVPGANPANGDELKLGCWAEHEDGSLIWVESTEQGRVIYSIFDVSKEPPIEYRDAMPEKRFKHQFSWDKTSAGEKWTWHDKTPFPWDRIIESGAEDGPGYATAEHLMTAAQRIAESLRLRGSRIAGDFAHRRDQVRDKTSTIWDKLQRAIGEMQK